MGKRVFIFDIDGVLLKPGGYRRATADTIRAYCEQMRLTDLSPDNHVIALLEAAGITCEWDHVPMFLAMIIDAAVEGCGVRLDVEELDDAIAWVGERGNDLKSVNYEPKVVEIRKHQVRGKAFSEALLQALQAGRCNGLFQHLPTRLLEDLFSNTRDVLQCKTTRAFQARVLGSEIFFNTYGVRADVEFESYLTKYDHCLLSDAARNDLASLRARGAACVAAATARYSLPPVKAAEEHQLYSPEAELAMALIGFNDVPLIGYGSLNYLAEQFGHSGERLLKPVPVQALAAIGAACGNSTWDALRWAYQLVAGREYFTDLPKMRGDFHLPVVLPDALEIHIFEDSPIGIQACIDGAEILNQMGHVTDLFAWGITNHPAKADALERVGAKVFADVNLALEKAL